MTELAYLVFWLWLAVWFSSAWSERRSERDYD